MSRQAHYYHRIRNYIFDLLGRRCVSCGDEHDLEMDIITPSAQTYGHARQMSSCQRAAFYRRQMESGNLQILCASCNGRKQDSVDWQPILL